MRFNKSLRTMAAVASLAVLATACDGGTDGETGDGDTDVAASVETIEEGTLTVCSDVPYAPFEFEDESTATGYTGFDVELVEAMAAEAGLDVTIQVTGFDAIQSGTALAAESCDIAASAMTITEEREENVDFLDPYFDADQSLLVKTDAGIEDLSGITTLGVQADTTGQAYAEENFDGDIIEFPDAAALFSALEAGTVEGILQDLPVNADRAQQDDTTTIAATYPTGEQYGFAVQEGNTDLRDALNDALQAVRDSGDYDAIYAKYFEG